METLAKTKAGISPVPFETIVGRGGLNELEAARKTAGLEHVRFHDLRHTAASWWAQSGATATILRDLLGHSSLAMTSRYAHLMTGDLKRAAETMAQKRRDEKQITDKTNT